MTIKQSPLVTDVIYSDFLTNLNPHPVVKDVVKYTNENAIIASIKNLLLTNKGERLYQPTIGGDINRLLFEPMSSSVSELLSTTIQQTIGSFEPRAKVTNVEVIEDEERNAYYVTITFFTITSQDLISTDITLKRVR